MGGVPDTIQFAIEINDWNELDPTTLGLKRGESINVYKKDDTNLHLKDSSAIIMNRDDINYDMLFFRNDHTVGEDFRAGWSEGMRLALRSFDGSTWSDWSKILTDTGLSTTKNITLTIDITDLQAAIDSLPKRIAHNVVIHVNPGFVNSDIIISHFTGNGTMTIGGLSGQAQANSFIFRDNSLRVFVLNNLLATTGSASCFYFRNNLSRVYAQYISATTGINSNSNNIGIHVHEQSGLIFVVRATLSNKNRAIYSQSASTNLYIQQSTGTGNSVAIQVTEGAAVRLGGELTIAANTTYAQGWGGIITNISGLPVNL